MGRKTSPETNKAEEHQDFEKTCAHHWVIEPPSGPVSKGVCKKCGAEREFDNWGKVEK